VVLEKDKNFMNSEQIRVTKSQALDDLIDRIVDPKRGFSIIGSYCTYDHAINGGCAIGKFLPEEVAINLDGSAASRLVRMAMADAGFEDPYSDFWNQLQGAHDRAALKGLALAEPYLRRAALELL
jgi:hypothetical protein